MEFNPQFDPLKQPEILKNHIEESKKLFIHPDPEEILLNLIDKIDPIDFREIANLQADKKIGSNHYHVICIDETLKAAKKHKWEICRYQDSVYLFNGACWKFITSDDLKSFLGQAAAKLGVDKFKAPHFKFKDELFKQFMSAAKLPAPKVSKEIVLVNFNNGTLEISPKGTKFRQFNSNDFLKYQLPFNYDTEAKCPIFDSYINRVLPDLESQNILAEYLGYIFIKNGLIKEEKALFLYGTGANGKSVIFEIVNALLGPENTSHYSLQDLTNENGYYRAMIANKLVNYASEISGRLQHAIFKQLVSGETISARLPGLPPIQISQYAKLIFNINEFPKDVEQSNAFFRRFLILHFNVTIPIEEQDKTLHHKIINNELSGVFNWVMKGLNRLLNQKGFSQSKHSSTLLQRYKTESDSVKMFLETEGFSHSSIKHITLKELYREYRIYCLENSYHPCSNTTFGDRLRNIGYSIQRKNYGNVVFIEKIFTPESTSPSSLSTPF